MKILKTFISVISILLIAGLAFAQQGPGFSLSDMWLNPTTDDFSVIQQQVEDYFSTRDKGHGSGYKHWKRWEHNMSRRLDENGKIHNWVKRIYDEYHRYEHTIGLDADRGWGGYWNQVGPKSTSNSLGAQRGDGRINCVAFHPTDPNTLWAGTPAGGLWKTTNLGSTWTPLTDGLPSIGVSGIAVHPTNTNIIYILTGDGDGMDTKSIGVLKTTNGGDTWLSSGLNFTNTNRGYKLLMDPTDSNILFATGDHDVYRTADGGVSWTKTFDGYVVDTLYVFAKVRDIEFKPGNSDVMYFCINNDFYKSDDNGITWAEKFTTVPTNATRLAIAVSPDDPSYVYILAGNQTDSAQFSGIFRSNNSGESFAPKANTPNILGWEKNGLDVGIGTSATLEKFSQANYDLALAVNPTDESEIFTGGINTWKSTDWGGTMSNVSHWVPGDPAPYHHADVHNLDFSPVDGSLFVCSDGGLYRSTNGGGAFNNISSGMCIMQFYDIADYEGDAYHLIGGAQDNGTNYKKTNTTDWSYLQPGGDGMDCMIDHSNSDVLYATSQSSVNKRVNVLFVNTWYDITPDSGMIQFKHHLDMDANDSHRIYWGSNDVFRSDNRGGSWTNLTSSNSVVGTQMIKLGVNNPNRLYAASMTNIWMTDNASNLNTTWTDITAGLSDVHITDIAVNPDNSMDVAVCMGGYPYTNKVFLSHDAGSSWTEISGSLPALPINCIEWAPGSDHGLYVGADVGVYYRDDDIGDWVPHRNGLPHVPVFDLEIHESTGMIRAGTYGRGMWESSLYTPCGTDYFLTNVNLPGSGSQGYRYYKASNDINSSRDIDGGLGTNVTYQADHMVALRTGFVASEHSLFRAFNAPCDYLPPGFSVGQEITGTYAGPMEGVVQSTVGLEDLDGEQEYLLVYPNPTNGLVNIEFKLTEATDVSLLITDLSGRSVATVIPSRQISGGSYKVSHDVSALAAGIYLCRLLVGERVLTERISVVN
jgi:photosystem II stability/assembly factor-like uncharacterized protein